MTNIRKPFLGVMAFMAVAALNAKDKSGVIMTIDGVDVPTEEFIYLYEKNNMQQVNPQTLDEYLPLFEIYRLKVAEAQKLGVDTLESFKKEMASYKSELIEPYITDSLFFNSLVDIAAEREKTQVASSHIMIIRTNNEERNLKNLALLDSLRTELLNGADFIELAKEYSQDKFSSDKGGYLGFMPAGSYPYGFETAVYETPEGEISEIIESHVGWHIVKPGARKPTEDFNRKPRSYQEVKEDVARKVTSPFDLRYHMIRKNTLERLKGLHPEVNTEGLSEEEIYVALVNAEQNSQYASNADYRNLVDEYINGSLLYEVSVENVWNKAANDLEGLSAFYENNKDNYLWETPHAKGILVHAANDSVAQLIMAELTLETNDSVLTDLKKKYKKDVIFERFNLSKGANPVIDQLMFGGEQVEPKYKNLATVFVIDGRIIDNPEGLDDVKSSVINDYQEYLEQQWVAALKKRHSIKINDKELNRLKKQLNQ